MEVAELARRRSDMLRIAMVSPYSLTIPGGVQHQVLGLARELRRMGHEVRVLGPCDGPPPEPFITPLGNSLPTAANGSMVPIAPDPSAALRTLRALNDEAFDILHLHEPLAPGPTVTALMLRLAPMVGTFHSSGDIAWYRRVRKGVEWLATHLDHRVAVSTAAREMASTHLAGEYEVLYNGIDIDTYRRPHTVRESRPTIFFCGRHEPRKGLEVLLDAFHLLPDNFRLWIASDGPKIGDLRAKYSADARVASRIEWLGQISEPDKLDRLARCTVFCAPSVGGESFGLVLLEAMAAATPVVAGDIDGYRTVVTNDVNGLLVQHNCYRSRRHCCASRAIAVVLHDSLQQEPRVPKICRWRNSLDGMCRFIAMCCRPRQMSASSCARVLRCAISKSACCADRDSRSCRSQLSTPSLRPSPTPSQSCETSHNSCASE